LTVGLGVSTKEALQMLDEEFSKPEGETAVSNNRMP
jgi:hypothetical protein